MSESEYQRQVKLLQRRMEMLAAARSGTADVQAVKVRSFIVREHRVRAHVRHYYRLKKENASPIAFDTKATGAAAKRRAA